MGRMSQGPCDPWLNLVTDTFAQYRAGHFSSCCYELLVNRSVYLTTHLWVYSKL